MSRNFELLQRVGFDEQVMSRAVANPVPRTTPAMPRTAKASGDPYVDSIVNQLFIAPATDAPRSVSFVCIAPTHDTLSLRVAQALAAQGEREVCFVDMANKHLAGTEDFLGGGLADALRSTLPVRAFTKEVGGVSLIAAGATDRLPLGEALVERIDEMREQFAHVLLAIRAQASDLTAATFLSRLTENAVLVIEAHTTRRELAVRVKNDLERNGVKVLGAVLTNRTFPIPQSLYEKLF